MRPSLRDAWEAYRIRPLPRRKPLRRVVLTRLETSDEGTFGTLITDSMLQLYSGELPWRNNERGFSCIPAGEYECAITETPKHGKVYEVKRVPNRTAVLIHSGNWAGDITKKLKSDVEGCVLPGRSIGTLVGQKAVTSSRDALKGLEDDLDREPFLLIVRWGPGIGPA